ncbi:lytic transglycosylase domain-containing protein [Pseudorhodobacter sp. E13]|uniref:lytic transglycosylase domain-containing protein n=1 Tax=Pseudorhodobacter sp. E13 TaxID=2487931 RepID=UPI000F8C34E8|nr:lytic transglycosylase domain-containing protein [Pseudorhodobacter sp. E13]RUS59815.1 lytic transglycosylase domain-containing protein [Pseudorhodobacter sp. E13]
MPHKAHLKAIAALAIGGLAFVGLAVAQTAPYQEDFSARRVVVPKKQSGPRITVQIDPAEQAKRLAVAPKPAAAPAQDEADSEIASAAGLAPVTPTAAYGWYWDKVPTAQGAKDGRFTLAMANLSQGPAGASVRAPRMQHLQEVATRYGTEILKATIGTSVSPALVLAVIGVESAGQPEAVSSAGAQGLMQLIPATAERFGVTDATDPAQNIKGGVAYLNWLMGEFDSDPLMVLAAYNAGEGAVRANNGVPPYAETRDYVPKVLAAWQVAQGLCLTPPELVTDPCVFKVISAGG